MGLAFSPSGHQRRNRLAQHACTNYSSPAPQTAAEEALREWTEPVNNFVYADVEGEFGLPLSGSNPHSINGQRLGAGPWLDRRARVERSDTVRGDATGSAIRKPASW